MKILKATTNKEESSLERKNRELARKAAAESFVLLENDGTLPLKDKKIALYGSGARMTVKGGTGSGAVRERYSVSIEQGLKNAGYEITTSSWLDRFDRFYADTYETYRQEQEERVKGIRNFYQILGMVTPFRHPSGIPVTEEDVCASGCETAIYVLSRQAGEGNDRIDEEGDYRLDEVEKENLAFVSKNYRDLVVVINCGGVIDVSFLDELHVSALVYFVQGGEEGGNALADVLSGKTNFSGKLATSWAYRFEDLPSNTTYSYLGEDKYNQEYNEGVYVGYRFFDTFDVKPRYRFGYGLSYTEFKSDLHSLRAGKNEVSLTISLTNTGHTSGKESVLVYAEMPYGDKGCEKRRLVAFAKSKELQPEESEELSLNIPLRELSVYDETSASWIVKQGKYVLTVGDSAAAVLTLNEDAVLEKCRNLCVPQKEIEEICPPEREPVPADCLPVLELENCLTDTVCHVYEESGASDPLTEKMNTEQLIRLIVGGGTSNPHLQVEAMGASGCTTPDLYEETGIPNIILSDGPAGLNLTSQIVELPGEVTKAARVEENLQTYRRYFFGFAGMALKSQMADPSEGIPHYQYATAWPCSQLLAQSFDTALLEEIGDAVGEEMETFGVTVWLAPGMNIHRNPLCGRTFEYYSEDPLVSGKMAAAIVRGVEKHPGKGMSVKHFAANNCELERNMSSSNMSERTLRELYLRGFEIAVRESSPMTVMAAYNKINGTYCTNNYDLLVGILRDEWGYTGTVISDWDSMKATREDCCVALSGDVQKAPAAQCDLIMPGRPDQIEALQKGIEEGKVRIGDVRRSAARVLKMIRQNDILPLREMQENE
ncbi:MAG: glycoside hydrolase family 3 C-terminal domain-containing protein [Erysipelotrichaceae bacterium]|nr:glycoside hydrolase family 3 C-terminal domain-containing protein [Erysipelotrichaceae bacterium]